MMHPPDKIEGTRVLLASFVPVQGYVWSGQGRCFTESCSRLECTLLARWDDDQDDPWLVLTDLLPDQADVAWYAMRFWIECDAQGL
jgi:hypothetical protein